ncbi:MAG TPA: hypothetical protein VKB34_18730 [Povalibacter sp.]|nr:hypothetical protein [Povalibacter sp.]
MRNVARNAATPRQRWNLSQRVIGDRGYTGSFASVLLSALATLPSPAIAATESTVDDLVSQGRYCTATAQAASRACANQTLDDYWIAVGICINESDTRDRKECFADAQASRDGATALCSEQRAARVDLCRHIGEDRYDPEFEAAAFDRDFTHLSNPNAYFPLGIGNQWEFRSATQSTTVEVMNATKLIDDVRCIVVRDEVSEKGVIVEGTNDWFAQARDGNVWYCGEETATFETFRGDRPMKPELVNNDGSFKAGRDGDKPGIIFLANPAVGQFYVEESSLGNAEDATEILAIDYSFGRNPTLDELVPPRLARLLCSNDCVVTRNFSQLEPGGFERKYYARGIGVFLETDPESGEVVRLVKCNVDPRCASLAP